MTRSRFRSPVLWSTLVAQLLSILLAVGVIDVGQSTTVNIIAASILEILTVVGILNNPTNADGF